jgi:hypothetical protein
VLATAAPHGRLASADILTQVYYAAPYTRCLTLMPPEIRGREAGCNFGAAHRS